MQKKSFLDGIVHGFMSFIFANILKKEYTDSQHNALMQFIKFGIVGVSNTIISYVLYVIVLFGLQKANLFLKVDYLIAQIVAFVLSVLWSFYWNNRVVFTLAEGASRTWWKALIKTYISYSFTGLFLNSLLLILWVKLLGMSEFIAPIFNLIISVPLNFLINKLWAFKEK